MSIIFLLLKFFKVWETPYDRVILLGLIDLDIIALFSVLRWWKIWR